MDQEEKKLNVKLAYGYYQNKEYKRAIELYEKLFVADREDFNVLNMLADAYLRYGKKELALEAYVKTLTMLEAKGMNPKVIKIAKKMLITFPEESRLKSKLKNAIRNLIRDAEKKGSQHEYKDAREIYENLVEFDSPETPIKQKLSDMNREEAEYIERARKQQEARVEKKPDTTGNELIEKFDRMAQNYLKNGDFDGAVETYITALKLSPGNTNLRAKLHNVYMQVAGQASGEKVWEKMEKSPVDKLEEAKRQAMEERHAKIMEEEEARAKLLLDEEAKIQADYERQEMEIIQKAAEELKTKLDEAQKKESLKKEEIQRIMKEQEEKKRDLLERAKKEAIEKWKRQRDAISGLPAEEEPVVNTAAPVATHGVNQGIMGNLNKAYEVPEIGGWNNIAGQPKDIRTITEKPVETAPANKEATAPAAKPAEAQGSSLPDTEMHVSAENLDSLVTTAFIYINQGMVKEGMKIYNKVSEKFPDNPEVKQLLEEITKKQSIF
jgi:tetratricopeptide (TPR) repeat protein